NVSYDTDEDTDKNKVETEKYKVVYRHFLPTSTAITQYLLRDMFDKIRRREDGIKRENEAQNEQMEVKDNENQNSNNV
ncbi:15159_t:CDS:1, partial [Cetraspora pellucida]